MRFQFSIIIIVFMVCAIATQSTSKYEGISWNEERRRWQVEFDCNGKKCEYYFENEFDAIKTRNRVYKKMKITPQDTEICEIPNQQKNERISKHKGVTWNNRTKQWRVQIYVKGQTAEYGGMFKNELDAAKKANQLYEKLEIRLQNPTISVITNGQHQKNEKISQYKGVSWYKRTKQWRVQICLKGQNPRHGGMFKDELNAAKRVNQLCEELGIPLQNPKISAIPDEQYQKKKKTSQYKGVSYNKKSDKWHVLMRLKNGTPKFGGMFKDELDAGKRVNQLCEELGILPQNPAISAMPNQQYQEREQTSQYKGVDWSKQRKLWRVRVYSKGGKLNFGGHFKDELDAAKRVNQLCEELRIPLHNPAISAIPNQQFRKKEKLSQYKGVTWNKNCGKWYVRIKLKEQKFTYGGIFKDELDAAKRVNQLCEKLGIPPQNPGVVKMPTQVSPHDDKKTIENPLISTEILNTDNDDVNGKKRKREKTLKDEAVEKQYFYANLLK